MITESHQIKGALLTLGLAFFLRRLIEFTDRMKQREQSV